MLSLGSLGGSSDSCHQKLIAREVRQLGGPYCFSKGLILSLAMSLFFYFTDFIHGRVVGNAISFGLALTRPRLKSFHAKKMTNFRFCGRGILDRTGY